MLVEAAVTGDDSGRHLENLVKWLRADPELQGLVTVRRGEVPSGAMGTLADVVQVALAPAGAGAAMVTALVSWLRYRTGDVKVTLTRKGAERRVEITANRLRQLDGPQLQALAGDLLAQLEDRDPRGDTRR
ncbi:hypothetical protein [Actinoplanes sp. NPDC026670]|uniref:effector-associated constant component EACC1 n=1 Tax=Actinoplanes sp. NPDC026670 TaxID=3154700 RepID=UPI0033E42FA4